MTSKDAENKQAEEIREETPAPEEAAEGADTAQDQQPEKGAQPDGDGRKAGQEGEAQAEADEQQEPEAEAKNPQEEALSVQYTRLMADFQNFRRRTEKEKNDIYAFANEKIVSELLNVLDNFERALEHGAEGDSFAEGMKMIFKQLQDVLEKAGVAEIEALGLDFDPNFHNAVMTEDSAEYESGKVSAVLQKGYMLNHKVIRPSMVKVAN